MGQLLLKNITISYGDTPVIENLSMQVDNGELISLLGPSGVGKTTLLKTIAGLLQPTSGKIFIDDNDVTKLPAEKRNTVLIFQKPLLFPFLDVGQNIGFGLKMSGIKGHIAEKKIDRIIEMTGLQGLKNRKPHKLSGGQQQRAALARGLVLEPAVLLLDEPFSNLDAELRQQMRELLKEVQDQTKTTMLFVTHDQTEALTISDRICLLLDGRLRQTGTPREVFYKPADTEVATFFGCENFITGTTKNSYFESDFINCTTSEKQSGKCIAVIRPEDIVISLSEQLGTSPAEIKKIQFEGSTTRITATVGSQSFTILSLDLNCTVGQNVWLQFPKKRLHFIQE